MKRVKLDNGKGVTITDEAYEQIAAIVEQNMICEGCGNPYTSDRPNVALNTCLTCFLRYHHSNPLRYVGVIATLLSPTGDTPVHGFLDVVGYINPSTPTDDLHSLRQSNRYRLQYYGYPVPSTILLAGETEERRLDSSVGWKMHGDFKNGQSVIVLEYNQPWGDHITILFLSYRNGQAVLLDKRKGQGRKWFIEARKRIEATKVGREYRWKGRDHYQIFTSDIYELVAEFASAAYEQQQQETLL